MNELEQTGMLVEEIMRRFMRRYQEQLVGDDYRRRVIDVALADLPSIVKNSVAAVRARTANPDSPSPYDLSARPVAFSGRKHKV